MYNNGGDDRIRTGVLNSSLWLSVKSNAHRIPMICRLSPHRGVLLHINGLSYGSHVVCPYAGSLIPPHASYYSRRPVLMSCLSNKYATGNSDCRGSSAIPIFVIFVYTRRSTRSTIYTKLRSATGTHSSRGA